MATWTPPPSLQSLSEISSETPAVVGIQQIWWGTSSRFRLSAAVVCSAHLLISWPEELLSAGTGASVICPAPSDCDRTVETLKWESDPLLIVEIGFTIFPKRQWYLTDVLTLECGLLKELQEALWQYLSMMNCMSPGFDPVVQNALSSKLKTKHQGLFC